MKERTPAKNWAIVIIGIVALGFCAYEIGGTIGNKLHPPPPPAPLHITFRPSSAVKGLVLQVQNTSDHHLACRMVAMNFTVKQSQTYDFALEPYKMQEIGFLECNWTFQTGETVLIRTEGFNEMSFTVP